MRFTISYPSKPLEGLKVALPLRASELVNDLATLAQGAAKSYTPDKWKGLLYKNVSNRGPIPGGQGVGGPLGAEGMLPDPRPAPKGIIAQFLMDNPQYVTKARLVDNRYIPRGKTWPMAWHHLPPEAKEKLKNERLRGNYQSRFPASPYWLIAEEGMGRVGVPARRNIQNASAAIARAVAMVERRTLGGL